MPSDGDRKPDGEVLVLGVGHSGSRFLMELARLPASRRLRLVGIDTDEESLVGAAGIEVIRIGRGVNRPHGCGGDVSMGQRAAAAAAADFRRVMDGARLVIVCAGLGGGTGTGAAVSLARHARDLGVPSFFMVTVPFAFEGTWKRTQAEEVLPQLREYADSVAAIPNDALFSHCAADIDAGEAFAIADRMIAECVGGMAGMAWADRMLSADFGTIQAVLRRQTGLCRLASGKGSGAGRWTAAVESFLNCPLIGSADSLNEVVDAVICLHVKGPVTITEVSACVARLEKSFGEGVRLSIGVCRVDDADDDVRMTGILCVDSAHASRMTPAAEAAGPSPVSEPVKSPPRHHRGGPLIQEELPIQEYSLGLFANTSPTRYREENLDVPTFQRKGLKLDLGGWKK
ncbi:MAG: hypothetical protein RRC34_02030 [Lentisphaeria bacterium]|nr:hypothetical protein [Lentisphaeria bacterium]